MVGSLSRQGQLAGLMQVKAAIRQTLGRESPSIL